MNAASHPTVPAPDATSAAGHGRIRSVARRFILPVAVSAVFILWAPFIGEIRNVLKRTFPDEFIALVAGASGLALGAALVTAIVRIRANRLRRYGALALAVALFAAYIWKFRTGNSEVDAVELFHFVEYGLVAFLFYRAVRPLGDVSMVILTLLFGTLVGTLEEWLQWLVPTRVGDARDVFLNLYAVGCGLIFSFGLMPPDGFLWRLGRASLRHTLRFAAAVVLSFAAFFHGAHLGYEIRDEEIGRFRSSFTTAQLETLSVRRAFAWARNPPTRLELVGVEDFYLTEGGWHAQARNTAYVARDFFTAWKENRILETYFDPFLDLRSFSSGEPHRWAPAQRAEVEAALGPPRQQEFFSEAMRSRIAVRPSKGQLWVGALALTLALLVLARRPGGGA